MSVWSNKGVHEERRFSAILDALSAQGSATMVDLGAYWAFYTT
jgi:hypothetical protein